MTNVVCLRPQYAEVSDDRGNQYAVLDGYWGAIFQDHLLHEFAGKHGNAVTFDQIAALVRQARRLPPDTPSVASGPVQPGGMLPSYRTHR